ncbi:hypothetical protein IEQ34_026649 [Dendrobium chrysotoxum]|uniref:Uncharacterized protein n=1 Tax=Dendrobium chrysotoxum TaxID=161865 RepID=A0AAV7FM89_DENCH|nr:hypothetical protein IEQ34_026649 [Dendrobium chrysotoxum]
MSNPNPFHHVVESQSSFPGFTSIISIAFWLKKLNSFEGSTKVVYKVKLIQPYDNENEFETANDESDEIFGNDVRNGEKPSYEFALKRRGRDTPWETSVGPLFRQKARGLAPSPELGLSLPVLLELRPTPLLSPSQLIRKYYPHHSLSLSRKQEGRNFLLLRRLASLSTKTEPEASLLPL